MTTRLVDDLAGAIAQCERDGGWRLDMIRPADSPRIALLSRAGETLQLERRAPAIAYDEADAAQAVIHRASEAADLSAGRAGMQYRDLVPGRLGGRLIASRIRIAQGGPVPDYVHHHDVAFQLIVCRRGWVRVVYEDQGEPFVMQPGDVVLQPPTIRHRVLEASDQLEVIELACPAEHATWRDHEMTLPSPRLQQRTYRGQRFVRSVAATASWTMKEEGVTRRETGIAAATGSRADVRELRLSRGALLAAAPSLEGADVSFTYVLEGRLSLDGVADGGLVLVPDDACTVPSPSSATMTALEATRVWRIELRTVAA